MQPYAIAPAIFWGIVLLMAILSFLSFSHELWRRIFPLSFLSQLPQHLGIQRRVRQFNPITERFRMPTNWMGSSGQGFIGGGQALEIPKILAAPMTLAGFTGLGYWVGRSLEHHYGQWLLQKHSIANPELVRHRLFCPITFMVFHVYFAFGGRPFLQLLPMGV